MDRLSAVAPALAVAALGMLAACEDRTSSSAAPPSRVNAAKVSARQGPSVEAFCDVYIEAARAPALQWPALGDGGTAPAAVSTWRWINIWATWCKPCIEEMPRLLRWRDTAASTKHPIDLVFVSVDESAGDIEAFRAQHPEVPSSLRLAGPDQQAAWFGALGLDAAAPIPIHVFIDPAGRVRCARAGGVREQDFPVIERLLAE